LQDAISVDCDFVNSSSTLHVYDTLFKLFKRSQWQDIRPCKTLVWMVIGLISSGCISLSGWADYSHSRARQAASRVRRFSRWLANERIEVDKLYGPIIQEALTGWGKHTLYLALDTSQLPGGYCLVRVSVLYRGRAVPVVWQVLKHDSSSVAFKDYRSLLKQAAQLMPEGVKVVLLADRGFCDTKLMAYLKDELFWHYRIRIKASLCCYLAQGTSIKLSRVPLASGEARFWQAVSLTAKRFGPAFLAVGRPYGSQLKWLLVSSEPTSSETFSEYGLRFRVEEEFLDEKSNGFGLEDTRLQNAAALTRLCLMLALASLYLVAQGAQLVRQGRRRELDPHHGRGSSYLKLGWRYLRRFLAGVPNLPLLTILRLSGEADPEPAMASKTQHAKRQQERFDLLDFCSPDVSLQPHPLL
jgi:hypothetical protein